jgi:NTE family protein
MSNGYKTLGLTLGGGGTKGFAHIGLYKILHEREIPIHSLAGCSVGAFVGAGIAQGKTPEEIMEIMSASIAGQLSVFHISDISFEKGALLKAKEEMEALHRLIPEELTFDQLKIPLIVNAVDLETGEQVVFKSGKVLPAVQASMSIPGIFPPVFFEGRLLVDGGVLNNVPLDLCRTLGAELQVAVDLKSFYSRQNISGLIYNFYLKEDLEKKTGLQIPKHFFKDALLKAEFPITILLRSLSIAQEAYQKRFLENGKPDLLIHPDVSAYSFLDPKKYIEIYEKGLAAGKVAAPRIQELLLS